MNANSVYVVNSNRVGGEALANKGAEKVTVRYLIGEREGSSRFALRLYTVEEGGHTPLDQHAYEHHVYVLHGRGVMRTDDNGATLREINEADSIFIPSNAVHQFINEQREPLVFLCVKGNPSIYTQSSPKEEQSLDQDEQNSC